MKINANISRTFQIYDQVYGQYFNQKERKRLIGIKSLQMSGLTQQSFKT